MGLLNNEHIEFTHKEKSTVVDFSMFEYDDKTIYEKEIHVHSDVYIQSETEVDEEKWRHEIEKLKSSENFEQTQGME